MKFGGVGGNQRRERKFSKHPPLPSKGQPNIAVRNVLEMTLRWCFRLKFGMSIFLVWQSWEICHSRFTEMSGCVFACGQEPLMTTVVSLKESERKEFNCALALSPLVSHLSSLRVTWFEFNSLLTYSAALGFFALTHAEHGTGSVTDLAILCTVLLELTVHRKCTAM